MLLRRFAGRAVSLTSSSDLRWIFSNTHGGSDMVVKGYLVQRRLSSLPTVGEHNAIHRLQIQNSSDPFRGLP